MMIGRAALAAPDDRDRPPARDALGVVYLVGVIAASVVATLFALATRLPHLWPAPTLLGADAFRRAALLRDVFFSLAVALPSVAALGHLLLPAVGATPAARRLDRLALGAHGAGAALLLASTLLGGWPWLLALTAGGALLGAGALMQAIGFVVRLRRAPVAAASPFADALWTASVVEIAALPVAIALLALLATERLTGATLWHGAGGDARAYEHWLRAVVVPLAALVVLPSIGVLGDALATATARPLPGGRALRRATWALAIAGAVAWTARLLFDGAGAAAVGSLFALAAAAPVTVIVGQWLLALAGGVKAAAAPLWFALGAVVVWVEYAAAGVPLALVDVGGLLGATTFAEARLVLLFAALGFTVAAALHRVWPRLTGRSVGERAARAACAVAFAGVQLAVVPELVAGARGMPRGFAYPAAFRGAEIAAAAGTLLWIGAAAAIAASLVGATRRRA